LPDCRASGRRAHGEPNAKNRGFMNNPGLVVGKNGAIIIDPGSAYGVGAAISNNINKPFFIISPVNVRLIL
jgi:hypothetical protein